MMDIVFAQQLTNLRKQKGLSQQQLADKLYMTRQAVSKWETGESSPDLNRM
ncbi:helix-turn-helix transcriptional regulator [Weissella cibaria]|nr:helix-turn-helix transcriptional regulator [Weissella cibaria]